jgi:hypothetical protein
MLSTIQLVSVVGSLLVLLAYVSNQFGWLRAQGLAYALANIVGSGILAMIAALEAQWGFLLLESAWALVSLVAAVRQRAKLKREHQRRSPGAKITAFGWVVTRMRARRGDVAQEDLSSRADELWFEMSKGLV